MNRVSKFLEPNKPLKIEHEYHIRWMIRRDMPRVLQIEEQSFPADDRWSENDFLTSLRVRNVIGMVAENCLPKYGADHEQVVAFMIYELHKNRLHLLNLAVDPLYRRMDVGSSLINKLIGKLSFERRSTIVTEIGEVNLGAHLFFARCGFRAVAVLRDFYPKSDGDAYLFRYRV